MTDEQEEKRLDELDDLLPKIMKLRDQEDLLLGIPVAKYDSERKAVYRIMPNGERIYDEAA
ncbi:MAG: hypothetical protein LBM13_04390 [Candidatus Ancillula sp.]|jgi:hypothetical protein|nr:hypothetical protein [Candidatus Ancillula sp.]